MKLSPLRKRLLAAAAMVALVGAVVFFVAWNAEPKVNGRPLSSWLDDLHSTNASVRLKATEALRTMGPGAVADLTNILTAEPAFEKWREKARRRLPDRVRSTIARVARLRGAQDTRMTAAAALRHIGPAASNAIPALIESLPLTSYEGVMALTSIGPSAIPALREALNSDSEDRRIYAMKTLGGLGTNAAVAIPDLVPLLSSESKMAAGTAAETMRRVGEASIPALTNVLLTATNPIGRAQAAMALWQFGLSAKAATNTLALAMGDPSADVRLNSLLALLHIHHDEAFLAPMLAKRLRDEEPLIRRQAVQVLGGWPDSVRKYEKEMEPLTRDADEGVRKAAIAVFDQHRRFFSP